MNYLTLNLTRLLFSYIHNHFAQMEKLQFFMYIRKPLGNKVYAPVYCQQQHQLLVAGIQGDP